MIESSKFALSETQRVEAIGQARLYTGYAKMVVPAGGAHVRQVEIRLPLFSSVPAITCTVFSTPDSGNPGVAFAIWDISVQALGAQTQIVVSATNVQTGMPVDYDFWCSYFVLGIPSVAE
jgi:hypothetical protein